jgi:putative SOS response-associated peptidase YedK
MTAASAAYNFQRQAGVGDRRQPYAIALKDRRVMAPAGLWERWRSPSEEIVRSFTIVTTAANALLAPLHDRMPVILDPPAWPAWFGEEPAGAAALKALLAPYPAEGLAIWPVDKRVGNVKNNAPSLVEPVSLTRPPETA